MPTKPTRKATRKPAPEPAPTMAKITVNLPPEVAELVRTAAFWTPGASVASIVAAGIRSEVKRLEKKRGAAFPKRRGPVKAGRPFQT
jgi:hypothetical protein